MARKTAQLIPATTALLVQLGERLRLARRRRHLTAQQVAERAGMAPMTLRSLERGSPAVTLGAYAAVLQVLGMESDLNLVAQADPTGRSLQDARLSRRQPARTGRDLVVPAPRASASVPAITVGRQRRVAAVSAAAHEASGAQPTEASRRSRQPGRTTSIFTDTRDLADLIEMPTERPPEGRKA